MLTPKQASQLDRKIDDGNPLRGAVVSLDGRRSNTLAGYTFDGKVNIDRVDSKTDCVYNGSYSVGYNKQSCTLAVKIRD